MAKLLKAVFSGSVQGVGFRYTVQHLARRYPVAGYVKNLSNGKVELIAEGEEKDVIEFLSAIKLSGLKDYIRDTQTDWSEPCGRFASFQIAF